MIELAAWFVIRKTAPETGRSVLPEWRSSAERRLALIPATNESRSILSDRGVMAFWSTVRGRCRPRAAGPSVSLVLQAPQSWFYSQLVGMRGKFTIATLLMRRF